MIPPDCLLFTSQHIRLYFLFFFVFTLFSCRFRAVDIVVMLYVYIYFFVVFVLPSLVNKALCVLS